MTIVEQCSALGDETRWRILEILGEDPASASTLARRLPVSRQVIAKHLELLRTVGLVSRVRRGREVQYLVIGGELSALARRLEAAGAAWDRRLSALRDVAEGLEHGPEHGPGHDQPPAEATRPSGRTGVT